MRVGACLGKNAGASKKGSEHEKQTAFLKQCLRYEGSAGCQKLEQEMTEIQREEHCVHRAAWFMAILAVLAATGLAYPAFLLENFPYSSSQFIVSMICTLGVGSLISFLFYLGVGIACRRVLNRRREECRETVTRLLESRMGKPAKAGEDSAVAP